VPDPDLVIVGGGPAGCAAAVMASSLGLRSVLVERRALCGKLQSISAMVNVLGDVSSGRELAARVAADVGRATYCDVQLERQVTAVRAEVDHVRVDVGSGRSYQAPHAVIATGVRPQAVAEVPWISQDGVARIPALWEAEAAGLAGRELLVLGIDRPLGTLLRTHADVDLRLLVLYSTEEQYKADEISGDHRVVLLPTAHLELFRDPYGTLHLLATTADGTSRSYVGHHLYLNLGSRPVLPGGDLRADGSGYCPPGRQHPRILIAGDLQSGRYQRIMTAFGSGAEAALTAYYRATKVAAVR
jgi:hypothetical protein